MSNKSNFDFLPLDIVIQETKGKHSKTEIISYLEANPYWGYIKDNNWFCNKELLVILKRYDADFLKIVEITGISTIDLSNLEITGDIFDIGAGGEGIIARLFKDQVIGIALEEHKEGLIAAPSCKYKLFMDARHIKFINDSFQTATAFFSLMYINEEDHIKVFEEVYRILKPGGIFYVWDLEIPIKRNEKKIFMKMLNIILKDGILRTGYGTLWDSKKQSDNSFRKLAILANFIIVDSYINENVIFMKLKKE